MFVTELNAPGSTAPYQANPHQTAPSKGMLFQPEMIRAMLARTKTVTRRKLNKQQEHLLKRDNSKGGLAAVAANNPYGLPNEWIYGKETFRLLTCEGVVFVHFTADNTFMPAPAGWKIGDTYSEKHQPTGQQGDNGRTYQLWPLKPSIFLPRKLSRVGGLIKSVRVERLQEIDSDEVRREGFDSFESPREAFAELWDEINGETPGMTWDDDPFIQRIEFARVRIITA
jgi:hypothetical protein